jgi:hypothetical protein
MLPHVIISQQNLITANSSEQAQKLQNQFAELWKSPRFLADLDAAFDEQVKVDTFLKIDRLELDLELSSGEISSEELKTQVLQKIVTSLKSKGDAAKKENGAGQGFSVETENQSPQEAIKQPTLAVLAQVWKQWAISHSVPQGFTKTINSFEALIKVTKKELELTQQKFEPWVTSVLRDVDTVFYPNLAVQFWIDLTEYQFRSSKGWNKEEFVNFKKTLSQASIHRPRIVDELKPKLAEIIFAETVESKRKKWAEAENWLAELKENVERPADQKTEKEEILNVNIQENHNEKKGPKFQEEKQPSFVSNAGMVILFPFLTSVFETLNYSKGKQLIAADRALAFLNYVEREDEEFRPHHADLYKIVCGLPDNYISSPDVQLTEQEKEESEMLLSSVISHWKALKQTSPNGLREGFLWREGKLEQRGFDYHLRVEQKAQDLLLAKIPWGYGVIQLPWMQNFLYVDW